MTAQTAPNAPVPGMAERPGRKRHWLRWILITVAALVVVIVAVTAAAIKLQPTPAPLALPATAAAPVGQLDGAWRITSGSVAGFRIQQTVLALHTDVVGRTEDVAGAVTITGGQVTAANIRINLLTLTSGGKKPAPQFAASLATLGFEPLAGDMLSLDKPKPAASREAKQRKVAAAAKARRRERRGERRSRGSQPKRGKR